MLVLSRKPGEAVVLDLEEFGLGMVRFHVLHFQNGKIRVGIDADERIQIAREQPSKEEKQRKAEAAEKELLDKLKQKYEGMA